MDIKTQKELVEDIIKNNYNCEGSFMAHKHCYQCLFGNGFTCIVSEREHKKLACDKFLELVESGVLTDETIKKYTEENNYTKLSIQNPLRPTCNDLYELKVDDTSVNIDTNKATQIYKLVDNSVEKCITNYPRLLGLMQYGLFITQMDGHLYIDVNYECVTSEAEELQEKIKEKGITFISKVYEGYDEALNRIDNLLEALGMKKLGIVGSYLIELKKQEE
jgi:hypothetical protein